MGIIKETKAATAASHARRSAGEGHTVLLYRFDVPWSSGGFSGPISGAAEVVEAIEKSGWQLDQFSFDRAQSSHGAVLLLFRRAAPPSQPIPAPEPGYQREALPPRQLPAAPAGHRDPYRQPAAQPPERYVPQPGRDWAPAPAFDWQQRGDQNQEGPVLPGYPQEPPPGQRNGRHQGPRQQDY